MKARSRGALLRDVGIAMLTVGAAFFVRYYLLDRLLQQDAPLLYFVLPVVAAAWFGGFRTGLVATILSAAVCVYYFLPPLGSLQVHGGPHQLRIPIFLVCGAWISWGAGRMHEAHRQAQDAAKSLRMQEETWRRILTSIGDAVIASDADRRVTFVNDVAASLTGWKASDAKGRDINEILHMVSDQPGQAANDRIGVALRENRVVTSQSDTVLVTKHGRQCPIDEVIAPICCDKQTIDGVVVAFRDVTERRRADEVLRENNRRRGEFLATLSHELRNPIGAITNALTLMRTVGQDAARRRSLQELMERQLRMIVRLIDDLSDVSRINHGKLSIKHESVDLRMILCAALDVADVHIQQKNHHLKVEEADEPLWLDADSERLTQVIINLIHNAARYTPSGGHISLTVRREDDEAVICVQDDGIGLDPREVPHLFELFSQSQSQHPESAQGLGIGLALVKQIVELHGGRVDAESDGPGLGSRFTVRLPLATTQSERPSSTKQDTAPGSSDLFRILVVDDSPDNAELFAELLTLMGHEVVVANDVADALETAREFGPEIIFSDITMPHMNGFEFAEKLRADPDLSSAYRVAVTGHGSDRDRELSREAGFDEHLVKPIDEKELRRVFGFMAGGRVRAGDA